MRPAALLDSNVLIAVVAEEHQHHGPSLALLTVEQRPALSIAAHSYAEAYATLTRTGERGPFRFEPEEAWAALESLSAVTSLVGLTAAQTFNSVRRYAHDRRVGARLYDRLIGEVAVVHDIPAIVTWNVGHMRGLFAELVIATPDEFLDSAATPKP